MPGKTHCALCRKPVDPAFAPFCSRGCRDRDLVAWLCESYRVPERTADDEDDGPSAAPDDD